MRSLGLLILSASTLFADGGMVLLHQQKGPFVITVFSSPTPLRVGVVDLSVLLQTSDPLQTVLDAEVSFELMRGGTRTLVRATREQARNKLFYDARATLNAPGEWTYAVSIRRGGDPPVSIFSAMQVAAERPKLATYWSYLALPFVCLAILALHQWLRKKRDVLSRSAAILT